MPTIRVACQGACGRLALKGQDFCRDCLDVYEDLLFEEAVRDITVQDALLALAGAYSRAEGQG